MTQPERRAGRFAFTTPGTLGKATVRTAVPRTSVNHSTSIYLYLYILSSFNSNLFQASHQLFIVTVV